LIKRNDENYNLNLNMKCLLLSVELSYYAYFVTYAVFSVKN